VHSFDEGGRVNQDRLRQIAVRVASYSYAGKGKIRTSGKIEFVKDTGPIRRDIRVQDFQWTPDALRELSKILWASQRAHSYSMAAFRLFSKIPSSEISPDGMLGGRGYIQNIKDMRTSISQAAEVLSAFTDTIDDEIKGPHWQSTPEGESQELLQQTEEVKENPAGFVQEEFQEENPEEIFDEPVENPNAEDLNPHIENTSVGDNDGWGEESDDASGEGQHQQAGSYAETAQKDKKILNRKKKLEAPGEQGSQLPGGTGEQGQGMTEPEMTMHTTTPESGNYASAIHNLMRRYEARVASNHTADSSVDPESLSGPRIKHLGPGEGDFNNGEEYGSDDPTGEALNSGVETTRPVYEDWCADGVTGYDNPTDGDTSVLSISSRVSAAPQTYSWLPGADNSKNLDYYALGMTAEDTQWLRDHSEPDPPPGLNAPKPKLEIPDLWATR
jgi:hypothetical protein